MKKLTVLVACLVLAAGLAYVPDASGIGVPVVISNIQKSFNPMACTVTISWTTSQATDNNLVKWDNTACALNPTYPYVEYASSVCGTSHSVTFSVAAATGKKIAVVIESANSCNSGSSVCAAAVSGPCIR